MSTLEEHDDEFVDDAIADAIAGETVTIYTDDVEYIRNRVSLLCFPNHEAVLSRMTFIPYDQAPGQ